LRVSIEGGDDAWEQRIVAAHYALKQTKPLRLNMPEAKLACWEQRRDAFHQALLDGGTSIWLKRFAEQSTPNSTAITEISCSRPR